MTRADYFTWNKGQITVINPEQRDYYSPDQERDWHGRWSGGGGDTGGTEGGTLSYTEALASISRGQPCNLSPRQSDVQIENDITNTLDVLDEADDTYAVSAVEEGALANYRGEGYARINTALRAGTGISKDVRIIDKLQSENPLPRNVVLYRAINGEIKPGSFQDKGFVSTAETPEDALVYGSTLLRIEVPAGTGIARGEQAEIILPRDGIYQVGKAQTAIIDGKTVTIHTVKLR